MKQIKNRITTKISDQHFENNLRIATTCIKLDIDELVSKKQAFSVFSLKIFVFFQLIQIYFSNRYKYEYIFLVNTNILFYSESCFNTFVNNI